MKILNNQGCLENILTFKPLTKTIPFYSYRSITQFSASKAGAIKLNVSPSDSYIKNPGTPNMMAVRGGTFSRN